MPRTGQYCAPVRYRSWLLYRMAYLIYRRESRIVPTVGAVWTTYIQRARATLYGICGECLHGKMPTLCQTWYACVVYRAYTGRLR